MERKQYNGEFKARVAIEAIKGEKTVNEIAGHYGVHPTQIAQWTKQVMEEIPRIFSMIQLLFLFIVTLVYHLKVLRTDGASMADTLAGKKQSAFSVLIVDSGNGFVDSVKAALAKCGVKVPVTVTPSDKQPEGDFTAMIVSGAVAVDAPAWIKSFGRNRIIIQEEALNLVWAEDEVQAAESVQMLAEGQEVRMKKQTRSAWIYVVYVFAALFALQLLLMLTMLVLSSLFSFGF